MQYILPPDMSVPVQTISEKGGAIRVDVLRLDLLHPEINGNKPFKLYYWIREYEESAAKGILSFGGAYSNHLVALAAVLAEKKIPGVFYIRGEYDPANEAFRNYERKGIVLNFVARSVYRERSEEEFLRNVRLSYPEFLIVPEGGGGPVGKRGAALISRQIPSDTTHIVVGAGTGATAAGLAMDLLPGQRLEVIPVLKGGEFLKEEIISGLAPETKERITLHSEFHEGGYAKVTPGLVAFRREFLAQTGIDTDYVYTAKVFFALQRLLNQKYFPAGSNILLIHTGGLQGNPAMEKRLARLKLL